MAEDIQETVEQENDTKSGSASTTVAKGVLILLLGLAAGGVAVFGILQLASQEGNDPSIKPVPPEVPIFTKKFVLTRQAEDSPVGLKKWVIEPPVVRLNPKLTEEEVLKAQEVIKKRRSEFKSRIDTFLKNKDNEFIHEAGAKQQLADEIQKMLVEHIPSEWIQKVIIPTFQVAL